MSLALPAVIVILLTGPRATVTALILTTVLIVIFDNVVRYGLVSGLNHASVKELRAFFVIQVHAVCEFFRNVLTFNVCERIARWHKCYLLSVKLTLFAVGLGNRTCQCCLVHVLVRF